MAFVPSRQRLVRPAREARFVYAIGTRAFVHCATETTRAVLLTDEHGTPATSNLPDGTEVEVLAWRPRGSAGTRYRVCNRSAGTDGWLLADELRTTAVRPAPAPTPPPPAHPDATTRRFGGNG